MPEYIIPMRIHLPLLREQKQALNRAIGNTNGARDTGLLQGILSLLDHIHDEIDPPTLHPLPADELLRIIKEESDQ